MKHSMKKRITAFILSVWLLPVILMICVLGFYFVSSHYNNMKASLLEQLIFNNELVIERIDNCITASRRASYDPEIFEAYEKYAEDNLNTLNVRVRSYLDRQYGKNSNFAETIFWFSKDPQNMYASCYNPGANGNYQGIQRFWSQDYSQVAAFAEGLDTSTGFISIDGRLYMVRNYKDRKFHTVGVLVMHLNHKLIFSNLTSIPWNKAVTLEFAGQKIILTGEEIAEESLNQGNPLTESGILEEYQRTYLYDTGRGDGFYTRVIMEVDSSVYLEPIYGYPYVIGGMILFLIPLLAALLRMFRKEVTRPIEHLLDGARRIEEGQLGYQLENRLTSQEFGSLEDSFNQMSLQLRAQFDRIYEEEVMVRDARIMALQSQINPHFMNNTLEIINWEARMSGDMKVSKMIEALSTLLDAAMDRKKQHVVRLSEEMVYVNAYLYIISERFGKRLEIVKDMPQEIMDLFVPRLILQPIIENAIEHGAALSRQGTVNIRGRRDERFLYIEISNNGCMTAKDQEHINRLLSRDYDGSNEPSGNLGIANVHQRLQMLYGENSGLNIFPINEKYIMACLTIEIRE